MRKNGKSLGVLIGGLLAGLLGVSGGCGGQVTLGGDDVTAGTSSGGAENAGAGAPPEDEDTCSPRGGLCLPPDVVRTPTRRNASEEDGDCPGDRVCWEEDTGGPDGCPTVPIQDFLRDQRRKSCEPSKQDCVASTYDPIAVVEHQECVDCSLGSPDQFTEYINASRAEEYETLMNDALACLSRTYPALRSCVCNRTPPPPYCRDDGLCVPWVDCPTAADICPSGCEARFARPFEPARGCIAREALVVACSLNIGSTADVRCIRRKSDGAEFLASTGSILYDGEDSWEECSPEEEELALEEVECDE